MSTTRFYAERRNFGRVVDIHITRGGDRLPGDPLEEVALPLQWRPVREDERETEAPPALSIRLDAAQGLIDALWEAGLRPTEGTGSAGSLAATERHLKDMQVIAMGLLKKEGALL